VCIAPWTWVYVDVHGKVAPCCYFAYRHLEDHFGVADGADFASIWNGETYRAATAAGRGLMRHG
jgi:hypothetical protein